MPVCTSAIAMPSMRCIHDRRCRPVEQDRGLHVVVGLLLPLVLQRRDHRERRDRAACRRPRPRRPRSSGRRTAGSSRAAARRPCRTRGHLWPMMRPSASCFGDVHARAREGSGTAYSTTVICDMNCTGFGDALTYADLEALDVGDLAFGLGAPSGCAHACPAATASGDAAVERVQRARVSAPSRRHQRPRERTVERMVAQRLGDPRGSARPRPRSRRRPGRRVASPRLGVVLERRARAHGRSSCGNRGCAAAAAPRGTHR